MELSTPKFDQAIFDSAMSQIEKWDFSLTKEKLLEPDYAGWSMERAENAEKDYKRYLALTKALGGFQPVPNGEIDRFWHEHILDTRRYFQDCHELFGGFLHHYPYFGMRGEQDKKTWESTAEFSNNLWESLFEEPLYNVNSTEQKCPQSCPDVQFNGAIQQGNLIQFPKNSQKCPQSCPDINGSIDYAHAQKCPQSCPDINGSIDYTHAQKCPQSCPDINGSIDYSYAYKRA